MDTPPLIDGLAVPSFVVPGSVAENVCFLRNRVNEIGLCFFETEACLAYTADDLPPLADCGELRFHIHLPLDLPWPNEGAPLKGIENTVRQAIAVADVAAYLHPRFAILHPPQGSVSWQRRVLSSFADIWLRHSNVALLLENTPECPVVNLGGTFLNSRELGFCLDTGHLLAYNQTEILVSDVLEMCFLVHWSAPGSLKPHKHLPLTALDSQQMAMLANIVPRLPQVCTHMLEIFSWEGIKASMPVLQQLVPHVSTWPQSLNR